jgi:hypothetical protein
VRPKKPSRSEPRSGTATGPQRTSCSESKKRVVPKAISPSHSPSDLAR